MEYNSEINNIFVIDDEENICNALKRALMINNYNVKSFLSSEDAISYLEKNDKEIPELIITDYQLKGRTGLDLLEKIKIKYPDISVILITGYGDKKLAVESLRFGADDFLDKPLNIDDVMTAINKIASKRASNFELFEKNNLLTSLDIELKSKHLQLIQSGKLAALGQLAASITHEINQPLSGISMGIDNIMKKVNKNTASEEYLTNKCENLMLYIERIKSVISHIRIFSREQSNKKSEKFNILKSLQNALAMIKTHFINHNIKIVNEWNDKEYNIFGNEYKLEQIIINLIINAKDAVSEKLEQLKKTENLQNYMPEIRIKIDQDNKYIFIKIEDNGNGISKESLDKIFIPFFTTKPEDNGTGLGLSIAHSLIKEMGGEIRVDSELGEWTKFLIKFEQA